VLPTHLRVLLKRVSRSFYLSVRVLPAAVQPQVAIGYLLARAADTIADTTEVAWSADERLAALAALRDSLAGEAEVRRDLARRLAAPGRAAPAPTGESALLAVLGECLDCFDALPAADRQLVSRVIDQLIHGMERDLMRFPAIRPGGSPPDRVVALATAADLDEYTYYAAGCVGEFWTDLMAAHLPALRPLLAPDLRSRGVVLGKALQMVNVVRDAASDLAAGRCYWPVELLASQGLTPQRLAELLTGRSALQPTPAEQAAVEAVTAALIDRAQVLCATAQPYIDAIPAAEIRVRLACTWPLLLADETLAALRVARTPAGRPVKVPRRQVYGLLLRSSAAAAFEMLRASAAA